MEPEGQTEREYLEALRRYLLMAGIPTSTLLDVSNFKPDGTVRTEKFS